MTEEDACSKNTKEFQNEILQFSTFYKIFKEL